MAEFESVVLELGKMLINGAVEVLTEAIRKEW